jgi:hypothetical protein
MPDAFHLATGAPPNTEACPSHLEAKNAEDQTHLQLLNR